VGISPSGFHLNVKLAFWDVQELCNQRPVVPKENNFPCSQSLSVVMSTPDGVRRTFRDHSLSSRRATSPVADYLIVCESGHPFFNDANGSHWPPYGLTAIDPKRNTLKGNFHTTARPNFEWQASFRAAVARVSFVP
jgi:hypothetical protein